MEDLRRELRKQPTHTEELLWERLRGSQLAGRKFRRQHSVGSYILDFYRPAERLAVEVDGAVHQSSEAILHDKERDEAMHGLIIQIVRYSNNEVESDIESVLHQIKAYFRKDSH